MKETVHVRGFNAGLQSYLLARPFQARSTLKLRFSPSTPAHLSPKTQLSDSKPFCSHSLGTP